MYKLIGFLAFLALVAVGVFLGFLIRREILDASYVKAPYEIAEPYLPPPTSAPFVPAPNQPLPKTP